MSDSPPSVVLPGAWPDFLPDSPPPPHLDQVLSFHKRLSLSFSSPILMPSRSPLLAVSSSASSMALTAGPQHDTSTSLSVLADESICTSDSSDSALEIVSQSRPSEPAPNAYASPQISRNQHAFPASPTEHLSKGSRPTASYTSCRPLPRLTLSVPEFFNSNNNENPNTSTTSTAESPLASPVTPPSPSSPGPIVFASPSSSSFSFRTPFPSLDPLSKTSDASPSPDHVRVNANVNSNAHIRPEHASRADSYSTMGSTRTEPSCFAEYPFPSPPRRPWGDFVKDNSREPSPSPLSGKDKRNIDDHYPISPGSRRVLSTIQATTPLSSNRSHTLSLSLTRPSHTRASSSTSLFTPTKTPFRSNSISSPPITPRPSFPSRTSSPAPTRPSESESKAHKRSGSRPNSISLLRSISNRSKARFSRSINTGDVSVAAVDYAAAQCEAAFISETSHDQDKGATNTVEARAAGTVNQEMGSAEEAHVIELDVAFEKVPHRSMFGKMKKFGGKVRKFVRVVRASLPSVGIQSEENMNIRVAVAKVQDAATQTSPQIQSRSSSPRPRLNPYRSSLPVLDKTPSPPRRQPRSPRPGPSPTARPLSLSFPLMGGSFPGCPFVVPAIQISPTLSPPGISVPVFAPATAASKIRFSSIFPSSSPPPLPPSESESSSPTPTLQVEAKVRARTKIEESESADGVTGAATLRKAKTRLENRRPVEEREKLRLRRATFSFNRMSSFWGWEGAPG